MIDKHIELIRPYTMVGRSGLVALCNQVKLLDDKEIPGSLVECGVWKGGCAALMGLSHKKKTRTIHLFDSFEGLPLADLEKDGEQAVRESGTCRATIDDAKEAMKVAGYPDSLICYHAGWFENTVPIAETGPIALLRLDGDWYDSTLLWLQHLYPLLSVGGFLVIDDYDCWPGCRRAVDEYFGSDFPRVIDCSQWYQTGDNYQPKTLVKD
jgi:hypothetical protein